MSFCRLKVSFITIFVLLLLFSCSAPKVEKAENSVENEKPKIVNIINFIRLLEPRSEEITEDVLFQTVVKQLELMKENNLRGTFLLQYDALMDSRYQELLKSLPKSSFEIGAWWEIPQPLVENAGMKWRGRYPWDWHADVGFATGYTPAEREKLVDVYMADFKKIYGYYPKSVGSWFIDAHSLKYMSDKYGIVASCNCKDQVGTDGYTMWGGYWNQAYYPSVKNAYMPAQNSENQIPVPVFRMLGSDPIYQYDSGLGSERQGVVSLEPVYTEGGGDTTWVNWYFRQFVEGECTEFAYVQAGQENSFTWEAMKTGLEIQFPLIAKLRDENKVKVETLAESGEWFRETYPTTPATSVTTLDDIQGNDQKTIWFNSRFYRTNLLWDKGALRFRDIHLFNEDFESAYLTKKGTSNQCLYYTLPFVDGYFCSSGEKRAGLYFKGNIDGKEVNLSGENVRTEKSGNGILNISWQLDGGVGTFHLSMDENKMEIVFESLKELDWYLDLETVDGSDLPFISVEEQNIKAQYSSMDYQVDVLSGQFIVPENDVVFRVNPANNKIVLNFNQKH